MDKFKNKYRIPTTRLAAWDYSSNAAYFVTICTRQQTHDFGKILNGEIEYTPLGQAASNCWYEIPSHFPFVELGEYIVMPNHVHGIVIINKPNIVETQNLAPHSPVVETQYFASLQNTSPQNAPINKFGPQSQNLASIIRGYKIGVTKFAKQNDIPFMWQERYFDHVIRNIEEHERIRLYIFSNVLKWSEDKFYSDI